MLSYEAIQSFVFQEARALDERRWADWLEFYAEDVEYWMPSWDDDDTLTNDPQNEVSLIYYANRQGLEDRVAAEAMRDAVLKQVAPLTG